ncbi:MAG: sporulation protein YabP [Bacilli bacterium]|nr:sporulation protein YabP [Bacilli bacterium]
MKEIDNISSLTHGITLSERKNIVISGVKKIDSFDEDEFYLQTSMGDLIIKGEDLEIVKLDTYQGNVSIKGKVDSLVYTENGKKNKENGVFNKLFK